MVSSWMVDFGFRAPYFLFAAAIAAFHRLMLEKNQPAPAAESAESPFKLMELAPGVSAEEVRQKTTAKYAE